MAGEFVMKSGASGAKVFVDSEGRLQSFSVVEATEVHQAIHGVAWNINTGDITLTQNTATLYMKNTGTSDLVLHTVVGISSYSANATGAGDNILIQIIRNPTAGTLIVGSPTPLAAINRNFAINRPISATIYVGTDGDTITDGEVVIQSRHNPATRLALPISMTIPQGSSVGIKIIEPTGNTSMKYQTAFIVSERDDIGPAD